MKRNSKIHLWLETDLKESVEKQAREEGISVCEFCRRKLKENQRIVKIEIMIERILEIVDRKIYKEVSIKNNSTDSLGAKK